jgi:hypothetical protein
MAHFAPEVKHAPNSLAEVFDAAWVDAAWVVVGRRAYTLHHGECDQLRLSTWRNASLEWSPAA